MISFIRLSTTGPWVLDKIYLFVDQKIREPKKRQKVLVGLSKFELFLKVTSNYFMVPKNNCSANIKLSEPHQEKKTSSRLCPGYALGGGRDEGCF